MKTAMGSIGLACFAWLALTSLSAAREPEPAGPKGTPEGDWRAMDEANHRPKWIVHFWRENGKLSGRIEKVIRYPDQPDAPTTCERCSGELEGKPLEGMRIIWDLTGEGAAWSSGKILNPSNGKTYGCSARVVDGGKHLELRGYVGVPLLGHTHQWERVEPPQ